MAQFLLVVALDLAKVIYPVRVALISILFLFLAKFYLNGVNLNGHEEVCLLFLVTTIVAVLQLSIFWCFFRGVRLGLKSLQFLKPEFLDLNV